MKVNIIGCGLSGATAAILLKEQGHDVEIFDLRDHIGGSYEYEIGGKENKAEAKTLLEKAAQSEDPFFRDQAKELLAKLK